MGSYETVCTVAPPPLKNASPLWKIFSSIIITKIKLTFGIFLFFEDKKKALDRFSKKIPFVNETAIKELWILRGLFFHSTDLDVKISLDFREQFRRNQHLK